MAEIVIDLDGERDAYAVSNVKNLLHAEGVGTAEGNARKIGDAIG